jgi:hypothetical protein
VIDRVLAFGDAWFPNYRTDVDLFERIAELRDRATRDVEVQVISVPADAGVLERLREAGVARAIHWLPSGPRHTVETGLEQWEAAISELDPD